MIDDETIAWYDTAAVTYAQRTSNAEPPQRLQTFIALLPANAEVLDVGCGPARASAHMRDAGLRPTPIDASQGMVDLANATFDIGAKLMRFDQIDMVAAFDGIWANFSLLHAARVDMPIHLTAIANALRDGGILHIAVKTGEGEVRDSIGRLYTYFTVPELQSLLADAGFHILSCDEGVETGCAGTADPFVAIRAKKDTNA